MSIRITTLSENSATGGFLAEWGLSILVEVDGLRVLLDTGGPGLTAVNNAPLLGVDFSTIDKIVLSHGHFDHTGGLKEVLRRKGGEVEVVAHPAIWESKYVLRPEMPKRYAGIPLVREELESLGARFDLRREPVYITDRIMTTGEVPMITGYEDIEKDLFVREGDTFRPDDLADDLALIIDADFGLVVILGCAHRGIVNTLRHAQKLTGKELVYAAIGGTHLMRASDERIEQTIVDLKEMGLQKLGVSHCTGFRASARIAQEFEGVFFQNNAGTRFTLP
ncbi:MAG: MBL fold metallo-hydrolase [Dehalococcoidia bacterium]